MHCEYLARLHSLPARGRGERGRAEKESEVVVTTTSSSFGLVNLNIS